MTPFEQFPIIRLLTLAALSAPMLEPLGAPNVVIELCGPAATGKSLAAQYVARTTGSVFLRAPSNDTITREIAKSPGRMIVVDDVDASSLRSKPARVLAQDLLESTSSHAVLLLVSEQPSLPPLDPSRHGYLRCVGQDPWALRADAPARFDPDLPESLRRQPDFLYPAALLESTLRHEDWRLRHARLCWDIEKGRFRDVVTPLLAAAMFCSRSAGIVPSVCQLHRDKRIMELLATLGLARE